MIVVGDASPLIALAAIDQLPVLRALYSAILIPQGVANEIVAGGYSDPATRAVLAGDWIETCEVADENLVVALRTRSDRKLLSNVRGTHSSTSTRITHSPSTPSTAPVE